MDPNLVGAAIPAERLYDCVNVVRSLCYPCWPVCSLGAHPAGCSWAQRAVQGVYRRQRCSRRVQSMLRPAQRPQHGWNSPSFPCVFLATPQIRRYQNCASASASSSNPALTALCSAPSALADPVLPELGRRVGHLREQAVLRSSGGAAHCSGSECRVLCDSFGCVCPDLLSPP